MSFLVPSLLGALGLVGVPLLVHLISRRRARRVRWGAMEFVLRSQRRSARSIRLRQLLLLLLRAAWVALLALALARPVLVEEQTASLTDAPLAVVLVLDASASMQARLDGSSAFERVIDDAVDRARSLPEDVPLAVIKCGAQAEDVVTPPSFERGAVLAALERLEPEHGSSALGDCLRRGVGLVQAVPGEGERRVVVLSDLAAHALKGAAAAAEGAAADGTVIEWAEAPFEEPPPNHALLDVEAEPGAGAEGEAVELRFKVGRYGGVATTLPADLILDQKRVARVTLPVEPGQQVTGSFTHPFQGDEPQAPDLRIALGDDALPIDNEVVLPVDIPRPIPVLIVDGAPQPIPFRDEVFYLESALSEGKSSRARLVPRVISPENLNAGVLAETRVLVLANVDRLPPETTKAVVEFVQAGGGLMITVGDQVDVAWANEALSEVLPGRLRGAKGQALLDDASVAEVLGLTRFAEDHPAFTGLTGAEGGGLAGLARVRTTTLMLLEPQADAPREVLAWFTNQAPALVERRVGAGRVLLLATTIDRDWSDLAIRPGFLPLVQQSMAYLAGALERGGPRLIEVGTTREIAVPRGTARVEVRPPAGDPVVLGEDVLREASGGLRVRVPFRDTAVPGLYRVLVQREGGELRELVEERFTVLVPAAESDLTRADDALLQEATPEGAMRRSGADDDDDPLWPWLLAACALLLLAESALLSRRGSL